MSSDLENLTHTELLGLLELYVNTFFRTKTGEEINTDVRLNGRSLRFTGSRGYGFYC
jgi:hypothetical protein